MSGQDVEKVCRECGRHLSELIAGGTVRYCWWCEDRAAGPGEVTDGR